MRETAGYGRPAGASGMTQVQRWRYLAHTTSDDVLFLSLIGAYLWVLLA